MPHHLELESLREKYQSTIPFDLLQVIDVKCAGIKLAVIRSERIDAGSNEDANNLSKYLGKNRHDLWAYLWATSEVLSSVVKCISKMREHNISLLEIGAGSALVSLTAATISNGTVIMSDFHPLAVKLAQMNAELNGISQMQFQTLNWDNTDEWSQVKKQSGTSNRIVLGSDILFTQRSASAIANFLSCDESEFDLCIISDPGRCHYEILVDKLQDKEFDIEIMDYQNVQTQFCLLRQCLFLIIEPRNRESTMKSKFNYIKNLFKSSIKETMKARRQDFAEESATLQYGYCLKNPQN